MVGRVRHSGHGQVRHPALVTRERLTLLGLYLVYSALALAGGALLAEYL